MSKFTSGKCEIECTIPFGIKSEALPRIAIVLNPEDARLIAAAPEMYKLLKTCSDNFYHIGFSPMGDMCDDLLARIDGGDFDEVVHGE